MASKSNRSAGRPRTGRIRTTFMIEEEHYAKLQVFLLDPKSNRMRYGAIQAILNNLLDKFMAKLLAPDTDAIEMLRAYGVKFEHDEADATESEQLNPQGEEE